MESYWGNIIVRSGWPSLIIIQWLHSTIRELQFNASSQHQRPLINQTWSRFLMEMLVLWWSLCDLTVISRYLTSPTVSHYFPIGHTTTTTTTTTAQCTALGPINTPYNLGSLAWPGEHRFSLLIISLMIHSIMKSPPLTLPDCGSVMCVCAQ